MEERDSGHQPNREYVRGWQMRQLHEESQPLTREQRARLLREIEQQEELFMRRVAAYPAETRLIIARNRAELATREGRQPSRPRLTAEVLLRLGHTPFHHTALGAYQNYRMPHYVFTGYFDFASGIRSVADDVIAAEEEIAGAADHQALQDLAEWEAVNQRTPLPLMEEVELYVRERMKAKRLAPLLIDDPTGQTVVACAVREIRHDGERPAEKRAYHRFRAYQAQELVLSGAEFAQRAYAALYPLTDTQRA